MQQILESALYEILMKFIFYYVLRNILISIFLINQYFYLQFQRKLCKRIYYNISIREF